MRSLQLRGAERPFPADEREFDGAAFLAPNAAYSELASEAPFSISDELVAEVESSPRRVPLGPIKDPDKKLKDEFLAGDAARSEEAFIRLYAKYEVPLLVYCKRMLRDDRAGEDA